MNYFFVLGARDPEMVEITRVLESQGIAYTHATMGRTPVRCSEAYKSTGVQGLMPADCTLVFVECTVMGLIPDEICDHHNPGDPGHGKGPEQYLEGSSLGQVLALLKLEPTHEQRIIAAADHCLCHAYSGLCPGVDPVELAAWREKSRSEVRGVTVEELQERITRAMTALQQAPRIQIAGEPVAWFPTSESMPEEINDASARLGIPFCYVSRDGRRGKSGIMTATPKVVKAWMQECQLTDVYGDPARGFAGGYL